MADVKLSNTATIVGNCDAIPTTLVSEAVITDPYGSYLQIKIKNRKNTHNQKSIKPSKNSV